MYPSFVTCPICGARNITDSRLAGYICHFCHFERRACHEPEGRCTASAGKSFQDIVQLFKIKDISEIYLEVGRDSDPPHFPDKYPVKFIPLNHDHRQVSAIWSEMILPFQDNIAEYFSRKYHQLAPGGLLYLSLPVKRRLVKSPTLPGQINFFTSKNIMFLLEQHGFKLYWRRNRFTPVLRIIAGR